MNNSAQKYDVIVIGAGHNGLVAAAYLARAGMKTLVLEGRGVLGGAAASETVFPGFRVDSGSFDAGLFLPEIIDELQLEKHGFRFIESPAVIHAFQSDGNSLTLWRDPQRTAQEISRFSPADAAKYPKYLQWLRRMGSVLERTLLMAPPHIPDLTSADIWSYLPLAIKARRMGRRDLMEMVRVLPLSVSDFLDEWFECAALKTALGAAGVFGNTLGPKGTGTTLMLLYQSMNAGEAGFRASRFVEGGMGCLPQALASAARQAGVEIRLAAPVHQIILDNGEVTGVMLSDGETVHAARILSSTSPRATFFDLVGAPNLEVRFIREVRNIRYNGSLARVNLALSDLPAFNMNPGGNDSRERLSGRLLFCPDLEYLERAYDDAKYSRFPQHLVLDAAIPTLSDSSLAPAGMHLMEINVQYPPYSLKSSNWDDKREELGDCVVEMLDDYAPGIKNLITDRQVLTPLDLERQYGLPEGCIYHGQMALDQMLFMRPVPGFANYRTPIEGLYLCGSGTHPGGGVTGAPGRNAAQTVLKNR